MAFSQYTVFKQTLVVFTDNPILKKLLLFIICLFVEFMRFNSYAAKLKTKIAHKSWPIRKNYLRDPQKLHRRIIQTMPKI